VGRSYYLRILKLIVNQGWRSRPSWCRWGKVSSTCTYRTPELTTTQQYGGYVTDITRTWPVNGKFTDAQRDLYTAVLNVQKNCVKLCRESAGVSLDDIHRISEDGLGDELTMLGFDLSGGVCFCIIFLYPVLTPADTLHYPLSASCWALCRRWSTRLWELWTHTKAPVRPDSNDWTVSSQFLFTFFPLRT